ncbi:MAG: trypsin-like peptidase domain-containing protein [bacterium]
MMKTFIRAFTIMSWLLCASLGLAKEEIPAGDFLSNPWLQKPLTAIMTAVNSGDTDAVLAMATIYDTGTKFGATAEIQDIKPDLTKAVQWYEKGAKLNDWRAQYNLAVLYYDGRGVAKNHSKAKELFHLAAESGDEMAQAGLGMLYLNIEIGGKPYPWYKDGAKWHLLAAQGGNWYSQYTIATLYEAGLGVVKDPVEALKWFLISASNGHEPALVQANRMERTLSPNQAETARAFAKAFAPRSSATKGRVPAMGMEVTAQTQPRGFGSGFIITTSGYVLSSCHVTEGAKAIKVRTAKQTFDARLIESDPDNDLVLLKIEGNFTPATFAKEPTAQLGQTVFAVGFPLPDLQGFSPKVTKGVISSLRGIQDDVRMYQIDAAVQPGNSGGPLADENGNIAGVIVARLNDAFVVQNTGSIAQNVNYAVKKSYSMAFIENNQEASKQTQVAGETKRLPFEEAVEKVRKSTVLVVVY